MVVIRRSRSTNIGHTFAEKSHSRARLRIQTTASPRMDPSRGIIPAKFEPRRKAGRFACAASLGRAFSRALKREGGQKEKRKRERERERKEWRTRNDNLREARMAGIGRARSTKIAVRFGAGNNIGRYSFAQRVNRPEGPHFADRYLPRVGRLFISKSRLSRACDE